MRKPFIALAFATLMFATTLNAAQTGKFIDSEGNVREKPETKAKIVFVSTAGQEFTVLEKQGEKWLKVQLKDGKTGWTNVINVKLDAPATPKEEKKNTTAWQARKEPLPSADKDKDEDEDEDENESDLESESESSSESGSDLKAENSRLKDEVERLQQEKMMIESSTLQSQAIIDKLKDDLRKMTALKEKLDAEIRQLKQQAGK